MKSTIGYLIIASFVVCGTYIPAAAQTKAAQTSSGRAAYGNPAPFRAHVKKNKRSKKKAQKSARRKRAMPNARPYRRLPM